MHFLFDRLAPSAEAFDQGKTRFEISFFPVVLDVTHVVAILSRGGVLSRRCCGVDHGVTKGGVVVGAGGDLDDEFAISLQFILFDIVDAFDGDLICLDARLGRCAGNWRAERRKRAGDGCVQSGSSKSPHVDRRSAGLHCRSSGARRAVWERRTIRLVDGVRSTNLTDSGVGSRRAKSIGRCNSCSGAGHS